MATTITSAPSELELLAGVLGTEGIELGPVVGQWAGLSHIPGVYDGTIPGIPKFVDPSDRQRLSAYIALRLIRESSRRLLLTKDKPSEHREHGDPGMLLDRISAAIVGDDPQIAVVGADRSIPATPDIPPPPPEPEGLVDGDDEGDDMPILESRIRRYVYEKARDAWWEQARQITDEWAAQLALQPRLEARQRWLRDWGKAANADLIGRMVEAENEMIVPLGDGVYTLGWDADRGRVEVHALEPDAYFPVLTGADGLRDFPTKVHLCWQEERTEIRNGQRIKEWWVERITYELIPVNPADPDHDPTLDYTITPRYLQEGETPTHLCFMSHGVWRLEDFDTVFNVQENPDHWVQVPDPAQRGQFVDANRVPLGYDFIPLVHVPNTLSRATHFGRSPLTRVAQLIDELARADTGRALAAAWAADPLTIFKGLQPGQYDESKPLVVRPPAGFAVEADGGVETVDMAAQLNELGTYVDTLVDRLATNMAVPKGLIGRVEAAEIPSGVALALLFTAFNQQVIQAHMARESKYPLLLKMVQRIALHWGDKHMEEDPQIHPARIAWGPYMPTDLTALANVIKVLRDAKAISASACISALQEAGFITGDHAVELAAQFEENAELIDTYATSLGRKFAARLAGVTDWEPGDAVDDLGAVSPLGPPRGDNPDEGSTDS